MKRIRKNKYSLENIKKMVKNKAKQKEKNGKIFKVLL